MHKQTFDDNVRSIEDLKMILDEVAEGEDTFDPAAALKKSEQPWRDRRKGKGKPWEK